MARTNDRRAVQSTATLENAARKAELDAVRFLMSTPLGRSLMARIMVQTGVDRASVFTPNAMNLAHDFGVRALGDWMLAEVREACPELELVMRHESLQRAKRADLTEEAQNDERTNGS